MPEWLVARFVVESPPLKLMEGGECCRGVLGRRELIVQGPHLKVNLEAELL